MDLATEELRLDMDPMDPPRGEVSVISPPTKIYNWRERHGLSHK